MRPHPPFRTEALNFLGDLANTGAQLSCSMRIILSWGELFSPRSYLPRPPRPAPPTTSQQIDIKPSPLALTWDNSEEPFQLRNSRWKPLRWLYGASFCPTTIALPKFRTSCLQISIPETFTGDQPEALRPCWGWWWTQVREREAGLLLGVNAAALCRAWRAWPTEGGRLCDCLCLFTLRGAD